MKAQMSVVFSALHLVAKPHCASRALIAVGSPNADGAIIVRMSPFWWPQPADPNQEVLDDELAGKSSDRRRARRSPSVGTLTGSRFQDPSRLHVASDGPGLPALKKGGFTRAWV